MEECRPAYTPLESGTILTKQDSPRNKDEKRKMRDVPYREIIGCLNYISQCTRPDITFAVTKLAQFLSNPAHIHWIEAKRILRYLNNTMNYKINYKAGEIDVKIWTDADWRTDIDDRHSFSGYITKLGKSIINWKASKQKNIATSTMEAEYIALSATTKEAIWLKMFIEELKLSEWIKSPYTIYCDNKASINFATNRIEKSKTKHIAISYHNMREAIEEGLIILTYVPSTENQADILTKKLRRIQHQSYIVQLGLLKDTNKFKVGD